MSKESKRFEVTTVWPRPDQDLDFLRKHCKSVNDMSNLKESCSEFLRSNTDEKLRRQVTDKISWLLKWLGLNTEPKEHQWQLVNSDIPAKHIKQKLYTFKQLLELDAKQASNLFSPTVQKSMTEFKLDLTTATNLTYFQKQILQSSKVQKKINDGELTVQKALKLTLVDFRKINNDSPTMITTSELK